jgi:hypothetical protein
MVLEMGEDLVAVSERYLDQVEQAESKLRAQRRVDERNSCPGVLDDRYGPFPTAGCDSVEVPTPADPGAGANVHRFVVLHRGVRIVFGAKVQEDSEMLGARAVCGAP